MEEHAALVKVAALKTECQLVGCCIDGGRMHKRCIVATSASQPVKCQDLQTNKKLWSCSISAGTTVHFDANPFTCYLMRERKTGFKDFKFRTLSVGFE